MLVVPKHSVRFYTCSGHFCITMCYTKPKRGETTTTTKEETDEKKFSTDAVMCINDGGFFLQRHIVQKVTVCKWCQEAAWTKLCNTTNIICTNQKQIIGVRTGKAGLVFDDIRLDQIFNRTMYFTLSRVMVLTDNTDLYNIDSRLSQILLISHIFFWWPGNTRMRLVHPDPKVKHITASSRAGKHILSFHWQDNSLLSKVQVNLHYYVAYYTSREVLGM